MKKPIPAVTGSMAESDARTLAAAQIILSDKKRIKAATKAVATTAARPKRRGK